MTSADQVRHTAGCESGCCWMEEAKVKTQGWIKNNAKKKKKEKNFLKESSTLINTVLGLTKQS